MVEANRQIHENYGTPERHRLRDRGFVEFQLESAERTCAGSAGWSEMLDAAANLAHGLARVQAFRDGNHRTGHLVCQTFLHNNGLGRISPVGFDDDELAVHLEGTGIKFQPARFGPEDTIGLFRVRYES